MNYKKICFFSIFFLVVLFLENFQIFKKTILLISRDTDRRMIDHHGHCSGESVGFVKYLYKKYEFEKIPKIVNFDRMVPDNYWSIFKFDIKIQNKIYNYDYIILLNYNSKSLTKIDNPELGEKFDIENYKVIENLKNCYLLSQI